MIVVRGAGRAFCAGYDLGGGFRHWDEFITTDGRWDPGKDFAMATAPQLSPTQKLMSIWRTSQAGDRPGPRLVRGRGTATSRCAPIS